MPKGIGKRLREERNRLGLIQEAAGNLGGVSKKTQLFYEAGQRYPDAKYLLSITSAGFDTNYIITGARHAELPTHLRHLADMPVSDDARRVLIALAEKGPLTVPQVCVAVRGNRLSMARSVAALYELQQAGLAIVLKPLKFDGMVWMDLRASNRFHALRRTYAAAEAGNNADQLALHDVINEAAYAQHYVGVGYVEIYGVTEATYASHHPSVTPENPNAP